MRLLSSGGVLAALSLVVACSPAPTPVAAGPDTAAIRTAILAQIGKAGATMEAKDTSAFRTLFADDAVWTMEDGTTSKGIAEIVKFGASMYATMESMKVDSSTLDALIVVNENEAVTFTTWTYTSKAKGKKAEQHVNPFADIWRKGADGTWKITREINADGVVPAPKAAAKP
jgi:uncharacterized protein (TIGR02246 family)